MATQDNQQTTGRHDPAIDPDTPDNHMGQDTTPESTQGGSQSQSNSGAQTQQNNGNQSGENSFTPDFKPEEHESTDTTSEQKDTGETDADIDTQGG
jgi:hypothetical protein